MREDAGEERQIGRQSGRDTACKTFIKWNDIRIEER